MVSFGPLSYSLPIGSDSSRAWRIVWDPLLFEFCQPAACQLRFDLETEDKDRELCQLAIRAGPSSWVRGDVFAQFNGGSSK